MENQQLEKAEYLFTKGLVLNSFSKSLKPLHFCALSGYIESDNNDQFNNDIEILNVLISVNNIDLRKFSDIISYDSLVKLLKYQKIDEFDTNLYSELICIDDYNLLMARKISAIFTVDLCDDIILEEK